MVRKTEALAKERLSSRRRELEKLFHTTEDEERDLENAVKLDEADKASAREQNTVLQNLSERERLELQEIDAALVRIEDGTYGRCEACRGPIGLQRLNALPEARFCLRCSASQFPQV